MSYKDFINDLKHGTTKNTIFFYGDENFLIRWAVDQMVDKTIPKEDRDFAVTELPGETATVDDILASAGTYSMFAAKRVILVRNFLPLYRKAPAGSGPDEKRLLDFAGSSQDSALLIFYLDSMHRKNLTAFGKKLGKAAGYEFKKLERAELKGFISKRLKAGGKLISSREMDHLMDLTGYFNKESEYTLDELEHDLVKLINSNDDSSIQRELVEEIMIGDDDRFVFNFIDALTTGDKGKAMTLVTNMLVKDPNCVMPVTALLTKQFEMMYDSLELSAAGLNIKDMAKRVGANEYRFKKAFGAARKFRRAGLEKALSMLYDIDRQIKTGRMDGETALELFVLSV